MSGVTGPVSAFIDRHFRHFNAAALVDAANGYLRHVESGGRMFVTLGGAMSTAELGISLAKMIRVGKVHAICCTGANLEEDVFNLVAHSHYERIPGYRDLTPADEQALLDRHLNRVTDTCIPDEEAMRRVVRSGTLVPSYQIAPRDSWLLAAVERDLPIFVPGWEDSTLGNVFAARCMDGTLKGPGCLRGGIEYMVALAEWYVAESAGRSIGFFQIGGGIAGDFPICVVPMLSQDVKKAGVPLWGYFCQISDSTTSYGSYSGAVPNEKITWGKLGADTPTFIVESDATIVAPLIFAKVLGW